LIVHARLLLRQTQAGLFDLIFPPVCVNCQRVGSFLCSICWEDAVEFLAPNIAVDIPSVDGFTALARHRGAIQQAIHALKYEHTPQLAEALAAQLAPRIEWSFDAIIPIPLHTSRLAERGYNQAGLLAHALGLECPVVEDVLIRSRATAQQVHLNAIERQENVKDAFSIVGKVMGHVLLIDDVCTTGSTLSAAAQTLRQAGVESVYAATVSLA
jgi:ComF family protein